MSEDRKIQYNDNDIVFTGTLILDGQLSPKQQKDKVFQLMHDAGVFVDDPDSLEISYEGVNDADGISETQTSDFVVYKKRNNDSSKELLVNALNEIKKLRNHLETVKDFEERKKIIDELFERTDELERKLGNVGQVNEELVEEFDQIDKDINTIEESLKESINKYQESSERLKVILEDQERAFNTVLLSDEEINKLKEEFSSKKLEENEKSVIIQHQIAEQRQLLKNLKRKKNKIENNVEQASSLGISVSNYEKITNTLQKKNIVNAILEEKGLKGITDKKANERTKEEKKKIKEVKQEIVQEISKVQKEENLSVLDAIEALYSIQVEFTMNKAPRVLLVKEKQLNLIKDNVVDVPERIVGDAKVYDYTPVEVPDDLKDVNTKLITHLNAELEDIKFSIQSHDFEELETGINHINSLITNCAKTSDLNTLYNELSEQLTSLKVLAQKSDNSEICSGLNNKIDELQSDIIKISTSSEKDIEELKQAMRVFNETITTFSNETSTKAAETLQETSSIKMDILSIKDSNVS